ncbi:MAG: class II aldolase/adducin family protein [Candidatus Thorarchaeota archaeon]
MEFIEARTIVRNAGIKLIENGLVGGTWGNISCRIDEVHMAITPSGMSYEILTPEDIAIVDFSTNDISWEGRHKPSAEMKLHVAIYKERKNIGAVIHSHSLNASTVAVTRREVPPILDDMVQIIGPTVRVADYALPSTKKIVKKTMKALKGRNAALMANHGAVCIGRDMEEAFTCTFVLEKTCKAFIESEFLGGAKTINKFEAHLMRQYYLRKYGKKN